MKTKYITTLFALIGLALSPAVFAEEKHGHDHAKKEAGPNGGRIVTSTEPHFEFLVLPDRKVKITFLGEDNKPKALAEQSVSAIGGERTAPTKLAFTKDGESLVSDKALPDGKMIPIVLTVKLSAEAKSVTEKFNVNMADCSECKHKEYACTCDHAH